MAADGKPAPVTDADTRDRAYRMLLDDLQLSDAHRDALRKRGLSGEAIDAAGYRTLPEDTHTLALGLLTRLQRPTYDLIPGLIRRGGIRINAPPGLLIPVRDFVGRIAALRIRPDDPGDGGKYRYLSSRRTKNPDGPSPGSPAHVPVGISGPVEVVRITEGEIKADVAYHRSGIPTVSCPGVASWRAVLAVLQALGAKTVRLAFDADAATNKNVAKALLESFHELQAAGYAVVLERWPIDAGKGIDDLLAGGGTPEVLTGDVVQAAVDAIAATAGADALTLECSPSGRNGTVTITATIGGQVLAVEKLDVTKSKARCTFAKTICSNRPELNFQAVEAELLKIAAELAAKPDDKPIDLAGMPEIDTSCIARPERFITPEVSGVSVPTMVETRDGPAGRWLLFLRWADGRRECLPLPPFIDLPNDRRLWLHPAPAEPSPTSPAGWTRLAREAWLHGAEPPDPAEVFQRVCERIADFIDLPAADAPGITATLALWSMMTYGYHAWEAVPYLYIGGPLESGKSRVFEVLNNLVFRAVGSSSMTAAAFFRTLHANGGTLLLDEAERLKQTHAPEVQELLAMLLAGYKRGGQATRLEAIGDTYRPVSFDVFGPKALACIAGLPPALSSRAIGVTMFRAAPGSEKPRRRVNGDPAIWQRLRDDLYALAIEHGPVWLDLPTRADVCPVMSGRDYELWQPLLSLAWWIESHGAVGLLTMMQDHAKAAIDAAKEDKAVDADEALLRILADMRRSGLQPTAGDILKAAQQAEPAIFKLYSAKGVSNALKRYGIRTFEIRGRRVYSRVTLADLQKIQATYGVSLGFDADESTETRS